MKRLLVFLGFFLLISPVLALSGINGAYMKEVAQLPANTFHNYVYNGTLYVQVGFKTWIYDVSPGINIPAMTYKSYKNELVGGNDYEVDKNKLYILTSKSLEIYDVSTPYKQLYPIFLGNISEGGVCLVVDGNYAYITGAGLKVVDVSNPAAPVKVATNNAHTTGSIASDGRYIYTGGGQNNANDLYMTVWDVLNPENPSVVSRTKVGDAGGARGIAYHNNTAYVTNYGATWRAYDVTNRSAPVKTGGRALPAVDLKVLGNYLYVDFRYHLGDPFDSGGGIAIWDITSGIYSSTQLAKSYDARLYICYTEDISTDGRIAAISGNTNGLALYDVSNKSKIVPLAHLAIPSTAYTFQATTIGTIDVLAMGGRDGGTWYWNITHPETLSLSKPLSEWNPTAVDFSKTPPRQFNTVFYKNYSYVSFGSNGDNLYIINLTGIGNPNFVPHIGGFVPTGRTYYFAVNETRTYVMAWDGTFIIYNNTLKDTVTQPRLYLKRVNPTGDWSGLSFYKNTEDLSNNLVFVNGYGPIIRNVDSDSAVDVWNTTVTGGVRGANYGYDPVTNHIYGFTGSDSSFTMHSYNISDPHNLYLEPGSVQVAIVAGDISSVANNGTDVYLVGRAASTEMGDIIMFDFSNPLNPRMVDMARTSSTGSPSNLAVGFYKGYLYVGSENGVTVWKVSPSSEIPPGSSIKPMVGSQNQRAEQQSNSSIVDQIINLLAGLWKRFM